MDHCVTFLDKMKAEAEDLGVNVCMELLNRKVNHADYMCDNSKWGVEMCKRVNSPRVKLLYDIYHMQIMEGDV
ncbi:MAG: TIM barrel protein, partial [Bryobacterales bacterium]|nr:TIM barrel protein [Bryobacterales bacterium]